METREAQMIGPIRSLMAKGMKLNVITREFSAGYGIADLVGASFCRERCQDRAALGVSQPIDDKHLLEVLLVLKPGVSCSIASLVSRMSFSESTLRKKVIPRLMSRRLIESGKDGYVRLVRSPPTPAKLVVAVEAKQTRWRDGILQARRYTHFADKTYVAVWNGTSARVDRALLYRHRLGLIGVGVEEAEIISEAPRRRPRNARMSRYCAEFLFGLFLQQEELSARAKDR